MILTCVVTILGPLTSSPMMNWLKNRPISIAHLLLGETGCWLQRFGGEGLLDVALFTSPEHRGRSCWARVNKPPLESLKQSAHTRRNSWFIEPTSGPQWTCATKSGGDLASS